MRSNYLGACNGDSRSRKILRQNCNNLNNPNNAALSRGLGEFWGLWEANVGVLDPGGRGYAQSADIIH